MHDLVPIGRIVPADRHGILPNVAFMEAAEPWRDVIDAACYAVISVLKDKLIAVLGRGSIMRGTAVSGRSDLDLAVIHEGSLTPDERATLKKRQADVADAFASVTEVEFLILPARELLSSARWEWMRFTLAHQGLRLRGQDFLPLLPAPRLDRRAVAHDRPEASWRAAWRRHWAEAVSDRDRKRVCSWLMKRHVRAAFERIMFDLNGYTRDLYPATVAVADRHPGHAEALWQACRLAIFSTGDLRAVDDTASAMAAIAHP